MNGEMDQVLRLTQVRGAAVVGFISVLSFSFSSSHLCCMFQLLTLICQRG
jgi:hypothetical protein